MYIYIYIIFPVSFKYFKESMISESHDISFTLLPRVVEKQHPRSAAIIPYIYIWNNGRSPRVLFFQHIYMGNNGRAPRVLFFQHPRKQGEWYVMAIADHGFLKIFEWNWENDFSEEAVRVWEWQWHLMHAVSNWAFLCPTIHFVLNRFFVSNLAFLCRTSGIILYNWLIWNAHFEWKRVVADWN